MPALEITPFFNAQMNCLEGVIAALANHAGDPYMMLFAESWGFRYFEDGPLIGSKIWADIPHKKLFLENGNGIFIEDNGMSAEPALEWIQAQLSEGRPVILRIDSYWCPWNDVYQLQSIGHYVIVTYIDYEAQSLYCVDPMVRKTGILELPMSHYYKGYRNCLSYTRVPVAEAAISVRELLLNTVDRLTGNGRESTAFQDMEKLAEEIRTTDQFMNEKHGYPVIGTTPLIFNLVWIAKGRLNYSDFLVDLYNKHRITELLKWADELRMTGKEWLIVSGTAAKMLIKSDSEQTRHRIADRIMNISKREQAVHQEMCSFLGLTS
ncbi:BtrH N-terminal domain-containing protein [Paenibacillus xylaniclasticus]|uniref:BtrH N-terminal domain-containing protein n=1 Tax=Paenibacillus xylaniclasticus TaxID=588083 RepID=UPI000FDC8816|nr:MULTISPECIES: BtrH N-terminal domain-containing protein [Paenibacillus]GFN32224.1 hypothetical protein PCURB6_24840 [Paenibacillus curdlanolyticus]